MESKSSSFELIHTAGTSDKCQGLLPDIKVYRSPATGLSVVVSGIPGPLVNGVFALSTESHSDDGCPHTLEHLIFLGSEDYPYKGVLDELANRNLSEGTNAWTDVDHTAYTLTTAGQDGFLALLPVYLDHILFPTLTESGFVTEVHHITDSGTDAGVVYCEMQARENTAMSRIMLALRRLCFPKHGYSSETGGMLHELRHLTIGTIRKYHADYYRPENLTLIITGEVDLNRLWSALQPIENKIIRKRSEIAASRFIKPWRTPVPPLQTTEQTVYFPTDDESFGMVAMGWAGPQWGDLRRKMELIILWRYLSESAVSPLQQALVECDPPFCTGVEHHLTEQSTAFSVVTFSDATSETMDQILPITIQTLQDVAQNPDKFDIQRVHRLIGKTLREFYADLEDRPHEFVAGKAIEVFLYGRDSNLEAEIQVDLILAQLLELDVVHWVGLLRDLILNAPRVTVFGRPSSSLDAELTRSENERIHAQIAALGPDALVSCGLALQRAEQANNVPAPAALIESFRVPDLGNISMIDLDSVTNLKRTVTRPLRGVMLSEFPFSVQIDSIPTRFVEIRAICNTEDVPADSRPYLDLYAELLFESNVRLHQTGQEMSYSDVIAELDKSAVSWSAHTGTRSSWFSCGSFPQLFQVALKMPEDRYVDCANWMRTFMTGVLFTEDRIRSVCNRLFNSIAALKRKGDRVLGAATHLSVYEASCNHVLLSPFCQETFLSKILQKSELSEVITALRRVQEALARAPCFQVILDSSKHSDATGPLRAAFQDAKITMAQDPFPFVNRYIQLSPTAASHLHVTVAGLDSAYLTRTVKLVPASWSSPVVPAVRLALEYLTATEGPLWKRIRGAGLSYSYGMSADFESGLVSCSIHRATNVAAAYVEAKAVVEELVSGGQAAFIPASIEAARASLSFSIISQCDNHVSAAHQHLDNTLRGVGDDYQKCLLKQIQHVSSNDLFDALSKYVAPLFSDQSSRLIVVTGAAQADAVRDAFRDDLGIDLQVTTVEDLFL